MKTIVCGPPHSGKSVLISNLVRLMPSDSFLRITANGDGEGTWSNNPNQDDVMSVRHKSNNSPQEFLNWRQRIEKATQDIVLVDIGGRLQDDKGPLFDACDSFIIVSSDLQIIQKWKDFGESHNCKCIAIIESYLDKPEQIVSYEPYLYAMISGLERGRNILGSKVIQSLSERIVEEASYKKCRYVDFYEIGDHLGCATTWFTSTGIEVKNVFYKGECAKALYEYLCDTYDKDRKYKLIGAKSNWVACIAAVCLCSEDACNISFYDEWTDSFIHPCILKTKRQFNNQDLDIEVIESKDCICLSFIIKSIDIDSANFSKYELPVIDSKKDLYISGRFPNWFMVSVMKSYPNREIYIHQPGIGYFCVKSDDVNNLGNISNEFVINTK